MRALCSICWPLSSISVSYQNISAPTAVTVNWIPPVPPVTQQNTRSASCVVSWPSVKRGGRHFVRLFSSTLITL
ncbi:hypothetical protein SCA6_014378 [Theobroma cacao]